MVRPRLKERDWADSKRTFCHSSVLAACSAGIGPRWMDRSIGAPAAMSPWRKPGASDRGPLAQVQGAGQMPADAHVPAAHLHLYRRLLVRLGGGAAQGRGQHQHPQLAAPEGMHRQPGPCQQPAQLVNPPELGHGVETPVEDAVAGLQVGEQPPEGLGRRLRLRGQVLRLWPSEGLSRRRGPGAAGAA